MPSVDSPFGVVTAWLVLLLSALGIVLRVRRLVRLHRIVLVQPADPRDVQYLRQTYVSTYLRLLVKVVLFIGGVLMVFDGALDWLWPIWRLGLVGALVAMIAETLSVDATRMRLGKAAKS